MRLLAALTVILSLGWGAAACRRQPQCVATCEQRAKELGCRLPQKCKEECAELDKRVVCRAEMDTWKVCFLKLPKEQWFCEEEGNAQPFVTACPKERTALEECLHKALTSPNPPKTL